MRHLSTDLSRNRSSQDQHSGRVRFRHPNLPPVFYAVLNRSWRVVIRRARTHPHETVALEDSSSNSPLHFACRLDPPRDVIYALQRAIWDRNNEGATALHIAASHRCSAEVIQALIDIGARHVVHDGAAPIAAVPKFSFSFHSYWASVGSSKRNTSTSDHSMASNSHDMIDAAGSNMTWALTKMGRSPLHYACLSYRGLGVEAFQILLEATIQAGKQMNDGKDKQEKNDDHNLTKDFLDLKQQHEDNQTRWNPSALTMLDHTGQTPLALLFQRYKERVRLVVQRVDSVLTRDHQHPSLQTTASIQADLGELWEKAKLIVRNMALEHHQQHHPMVQTHSTWHPRPLIQDLITPESSDLNSHHTWNPTHQNPLEENQSSSSNPPPTKHFRILHASVSLTGYGCPSEMICLALSIHPQEIREMDEDGNLPIHIASMAPNYLCHHESVVSSKNMKKWSLMDRYPFDNVIRLLLRYYPQGAQVPHGLSGHLPLRLALDAKQRTWDDGLLALIQAFPPALDSCPLDLPLYPYILSLLGQSKKIGDSSHQVEGLVGERRNLLQEDDSSVMNDRSLISVLLEVVRSKPTLFGR